MTKLQKSLAVLGSAVVLLGLGSTVLAASSGDSFLSDIKKLVAHEIVTLILAGKDVNLGGQDTNGNQGDAVLGSTQTPATYATAESVSNEGGLYLWDTDSNSGLEVAGPTHMASATIVSLAASTSTIGFATGQLNVTTAAFNSASTTMCSIQNTSGADRVITSAFIDLAAGTSAVNVASQWRGYVSAGRANNSVTATGTLFSQTFLASSTLAVAYGGPVPNSYYVSSTATNAFLTVLSLTTSTPVMWPNGWYANVTSTAITSSTGNCKLNWFGF